MEKEFPISIYIFTVIIMIIVIIFDILCSPVRTVSLFFSLTSVSMYLTFLRFISIAT